MTMKSLESIVSLVGLAVCVPACRVTVPGPPAYVARPVYHPTPPPRVVYAPPPQPGPPPPGAPSQQPPPTPNQYAAAGPACSDPGERDFPDRYDQAVAIEPQSQTVGCMAYKDADMFVVTPPAAKGGQIIRVSLRGQNKMAPFITLFDGDRRQLTHFFTPASVEARGWVHASGGKPIYVQVTAEMWTTDTYTLTVTTEPLADATEPNDDMSMATPLREGVSVKAFMSDVANNPGAVGDWYRIDLAHEGPVTIDLDMSPGVAPRIALFDADRKPVGARFGGAGEVIHLPLKLRRGVYYAKVDSYGSIASAGGGDVPARLTRPYTITVH